MLKAPLERTKSLLALPVARPRPEVGLSDQIGKNSPEMIKNINKLGTCYNTCKMDFCIEIAVNIRVVIIKRTIGSDVGESGGKGTNCRDQ